MAPPVRIAVLGAGAIGRRHAFHVAGCADAALAAVVDPDEAARAVADAHGAPWFPDFDALLRHRRPDAVVIATPNRLHVRQGLQAVAAGIPALVEKPLADDPADAATLVDTAEQAGVPLLTGHHRRHNPLVAAARAAIAANRLGRVVAAHGQCWFRKPASYFDAPWRRAAGAGPVLLNLVHDVDLLRYLCGEVTEVQAMDSNAVRRGEVEDTAGILLRFASGALGTLTVSDAAVSPWSWECTSGENADFPQTDQWCCTVAGTAGALAIPPLDLWTDAAGATPDWMRPLRRDTLAPDPATAGVDPLAAQIRNLCQVVRGTAAPVVSGREGLQTLRVVAAARQAARTGQPVRVG